MEVPEMEEAKPETHMTSAAAFVEGGIQQACDDSCSICLEDFSESDPLTVTTCKHEFHLQCILEWCQRSSQCPMCWQAISLKDPTSQELLEAVERERRIRVTLPRNATIFHHPTLGDFELQHLPVGANSAELEERIIQHLAAAAAMGRAHHIGRREGQRIRSSTFLPTNRQGISFNNRSPASHSSPQNQDRAGPSDFQSFSESLKSRLNAMSMKYKESLSKSTRGWKERLFSRNTSMPDVGSEVRREVNSGIASVSRMMEHLETRENSRDSEASVANHPDDSPVTDQSIQNIAETRGENPLNDSKQPISCAASSASS